MKHIRTLGILTIMCISTLTMALAQEPVPVREGEPITKALPQRTPPVVIDTEGAPVPVGMALAPIAPAKPSTQQVEFSRDLVPVDENAEPIPENVILSGSPPIAMDDFYVAVTNEALQISVDAGVLSNDFDPEGDGLTVTLIINSVDHGTLSVFQGGNFNYTSDSGYVGYDYFDMRISDGTNQEINRVHIQVVSVDRPPVAQNEYYQVPMNGDLIVPSTTGLLLNDFDPDADSVAVSLVLSGVEHGSVSVFTNGRFNYYPDSGFTGSDSFTYRISANGVSTTAMCSITVFDPNRSPYAEMDHYYVPMNGTLSVLGAQGVLRNDFDPDGDSINVNLITNGADHGSLSVYPNGRFNYTPDVWYSGLDTFTYRMADSNGANTTATVTVFVGQENNLTALVDPLANPGQFGMSPPMPNPFNPRTKIDFRIDTTAQTTLRVFDVRGFLVKTLVDEELPTGNHTVHWDGTNDRGMSMASGTYFATLASGTNHASQRLALVK